MSQAWHHSTKSLSGFSMNFILSSRIVQHTYIKLSSPAAHSQRFRRRDSYDVCSCKISSMLDPWLCLARTAGFSIQHDGLNQCIRFWYADRWLKNLSTNCYQEYVSSAECLPSFGSYSIVHHNTLFSFPGIPEQNLDHLFGATVLIKHGWQKRQLMMFEGIKEILPKECHEAQ